MTTQREQWRDTARRVIQVSLFMLILIVVGCIVEIVLSKGATKEILQEVGSEFLGGRGGDVEKTKLFIIISGLLLLLTIATQFVYALRIRQFAGIQPDDDEQRLMTKASTGGYVQLAALLLLIATPFIVSDGTIALPLFFAAWVTAIVGTVMMKNAFKTMGSSDVLDDTGKLGAENLRHASVCQLRLLIMPVVYVLFNALMLMLFMSTLKSAWNGAEFNALSLDQLGRSITDFSDRADSSVASLRVIYYLYIIGMAVLTFFTILWALFSLVKPITGWNRIMNGLVPSEGETEEDTATEDNPVAALLQKVLSWHWAVVAAILTLLFMLPLLPGTSHDAASDDETEYVMPEEEKEKEDNNESASAVKEKTAFPEGPVTDYHLTVCDDDMSEDYCNYMIYATKGGETVYTQIAIPSCLGNIVDQHDYDGDGNVDALIAWAYSVTERGQQFIISYNFITGQFERTEDFDIDVTPEQNGNIWTFRLDQGTVKQRYALVLGQFVKINDESIKTGDVVRTFGVDDIFGPTGCADYEEKTYPYDLNDDGRKETLTFSRNPWLPGRYGSNLFLERIAYNGKEITFIENASDNVSYGGVITILSSTSQGWHDILIESETGTYLYRWNGNKYNEVK